MLNEIVRAYSEPHRRYHTLLHIGEMFAAAAYHGLRELSAATVYAIWFHDFVYDPKAAKGVNEHASIMAMIHLLPVDVDSDVADEAAGMIEDTIEHAPRTPASRIVQDLDLAILAAPRERYAQYMNQIRREYDHVSDDDFKAGRAAILREFNTRAIHGELFRTAALADLNAEAADNLAWELRLRL